MTHRTPSVPSSILALLAAALLGCGGAGDEGEVRQASARGDWSAIQARDTLTALMAYNSTGYFVYRGEPMGFEYDLLRAFAEEHDLELKTIVADRDRIVDRLSAGEGDVAAARLVPSEEEAREVAYTTPLYSTPPTLVQQGTPAARAEVPAAVDTVLKTRPATSPIPPGVAAQPSRTRARLVSRPSQLAGRKVYVPSNPAFVDRLVEISDSVGDIHVVELEDDVSAEALIRSVARGGVELAAAPANLAALRASYFSNVVVQPTLGAPMRVAWAVRRDAPQLLGQLNEWLARDSTQALMKQLYEKYFVDRRGYQERVESEYLTSETERLSEYDALLKRHAEEIGWDWRLLASQAFQESRFDPDARSWAGAEGLLQLMPGTAREVGVSNSRDPEQNVAGAVRHLRGLLRTWGDKIPDPAERLRFVLAAYNVGTGHVQDAQRLAEKHGDNPQVWDDVAYWLLQKSKRSVYSDPVVEHGFARGLEPVMYVSRILERFDHYRQFVRPGGAAEERARAR